MSDPTTLQEARTAALTSDYYALGYLNLCTVSYALEGSPAPTIVQAIQQTVPKIPTYPDNGTWKLEWGPGILANGANLMYVASYYFGGDASSPVFTAVVIRGTDVQRKGFGLIKQIEEDLEGHCQVPWPGGGPCAPVPPPPISGALVAKGTWDGLQALLTLTDPTSGATLTDFLPTFLAQPQFAGIPLVVTGHSLGGALTQVMAPYLYTFVGGSQNVSATIVPNTFAGPSAGNGAFVAGYEQTFPYCPRWYNTLDLVPMAFAEVDDMDNLWSVGTWNCNDLTPPDWAKAGISYVKGRVKGRDYQQQTGAMARTLTGVCDCSSSALQASGMVTAPAEALASPWFQMLLCQHLPPNGYYRLMVNFPGVKEVPAVVNPTP